MTRAFRFQEAIIGAAVLVLIGLGAGLYPPRSLAAENLGDEALKLRFEYLSQNGNSNCSGEFLDSITAMPATALLQGSCCSRMDEHRYVEQVRGLTKYAEIALITSDPYDIPAGIAQQLLPHYSTELTPVEQAAYDYAMKHSDEQGPCCCECWRWHVYGGLAKYLIREHGFTGEQIADVWDLSDGCGGSGEHVH
ncbi:hypothetical protein [Nitratireductor luteus]|uniref:hypothetical protein n=1 Tax=Nitratireductor luteus TaxID=2976980 RepID=UPI00223EAF1F|nr:hypothetical protein [Nitratireductor luteus]